MRAPCRQPEPDAMPAALRRLADPPTNAPIRPAIRRSAGGQCVDGLLHGSSWQQIAGAYSDGLRTRHIAVGGACALQHYAGRFVLAALGFWVQSGHLLPVDHSHWWVQLDRHGRTTGVCPPDVPGPDRPRTVSEAAEAILGDHLRPIVAAVRAATPITDRVAFGCIAASCAGAFAALHRRCAIANRARVKRLATSFLHSVSWPEGRPLVRLTEVRTPSGPVLAHERHVCCLIRLGADHDACGTCPHIDEAERLTRTRAGALSAEQAHDLPTAVTCVGV